MKETTTFLIGGIAIGALAVHLMRKKEKSVTNIAVAEAEEMSEALGGGAPSYCPRTDTLHKKLRKGSLACRLACNTDARKQTNV